MSEKLTIVSPRDGSVVAERAAASAAEIARVLAAAEVAQESWRRVPVAERVAVLRRGVDAFVARGEEIAREISLQMGRPVRDAPGEVRGFEERARHMLSIAEASLADVVPEPRPGFRRFIRRDPLGVVLTIAPWNYPYLTAVNSVVPALAAGNAVILRHSEQTLLCAERMADAFVEGGLPIGVLQALHCDHAAVSRLIASPEIAFVAFTGSVGGGHAIQQAASSRFIATGLELGGKDPAYVRADAPFEHSVESLVDGAFYNAGQSCCGIERIYVHADLHDRFVEAYAAAVATYRLGDPLEETTTLGPLVRTSAADHVREQLAEAIGYGARPLVDESRFELARPDTPYLAPQVLSHVDAAMRVMSEESFGPIVGIQRVASDDEAIRWMNDSDYGLTASIWSTDDEAALALGERIETGTVFQNRCDYLDPALAWTGVKDSGRGCTLSSIGFESLTRPKSYHLRDGSDVLGLVLGPSGGGEGE
ncbi:MAG: aldehyde dehydrogenase family protein [Myxococcota bacterium]|nr:aldehyde dehydrogenase family protein [Myxococcota bacterium]